MVFYDLGLEERSSQDFEGEITNFMAFHHQDSALITSRNQILQYNSYQLTKTQTLTDFDKIQSPNLQVLYQAFNYDSFKIFGCVLTNEIRFYDYRFPKSGILSLDHNSCTPPEKFQFSQSRSQFLGLEDLLTKELEELESELSQFWKIFLYSTRRCGGICTFPHVKYPDKELIINRFAYNLIKEVNMTTQQNNKFSLLFEHTSELTQLYHSSLMYESIGLTGFQSIKINSLYVNFSLEENCLLNVQIFDESEKKQLQFLSFTESPDVFQQVFNERLCERNDDKSYLSNFFKRQKAKSEDQKVEFPRRKKSLHQSKFLK